MMKWKVVKNPRSASVDRSLECLKNDNLQQQPKSNSNNDSNNNVGSNDCEEANKQDNSPPAKEAKQRDSSLVRKTTAALASECINLRNILGLTRQRSETNLSNLGLISAEPRRSRSEVRGISCDRLIFGCHVIPPKPVENGKTRSSSPPTKSGCWLRGRKRERESRSSSKNSPEALGKTVVTGSCSKRTSSRARNSDGRTIVDGSDSKAASSKSALDPPRKGKASKRGGENDIIEEEVIYSEIPPDNVCGKLLAEKKEVFKVPTKVIRKKGQAPKPQVTNELFREAKRDSNSSPSRLKTNGSLISLNEPAQMPVGRKQPKKNQTFNGRNQEKRADHRAMQTVKINNLKNNGKDSLKSRNKISLPTPMEVVEVHREKTPPIPETNNKMEIPELELPGIVDQSEDLSNKKLLTETPVTEEPESLPFHIDTPDYSTLDSANCNSISMDDVMFSNGNTLNYSTECDENAHESYPLIMVGTPKMARDISLSSILRDSSNDNKGTVDLEPKKSVRFEKMDLIEKYKKNKTENLMDTEDDMDCSMVYESKPLINSFLDVNSNEILSSDIQSLTDDTSQSLDDDDDDDNNKYNTESRETKNLTVNLLVRNPSPPSHMPTNEEASTPQCVVKKSFVLTVAKQEKGFKSLCANRKAEAPTELTQHDQQISVTFLCSGPTSESWGLPTAEEQQRLRSTSVPPRSLQVPDMLMNAQPGIRGRSRERRSKERQHCRKGHKSRKKDAVFVMPQAVIDELSQVLEKRKPSLDEIPVHQ